MPLEDLNLVAGRFIDALRARGSYLDLDQSLKLGLPELRVVPQRDKAAALGVDARTVASTVHAMVGGVDVGVFKEAGRRYDIRMRLEGSSRAEPAAISRLYVRSQTGEVVELANLVRVESGAAPSAITRSDRQRSVTITGNLVGKTLARPSGSPRRWLRSSCPRA